ncbi:MAG TPA: hypothetical protein GXZ56_05055 [Bacteroidales bacterium]|nr:hypothetical protein [Bacteroidales bacterium]
MKQKILLLTSFLALLIGSCKEDEILPNPPVISGIEAEYTIIEGETLLLKPTVENSENAIYRWLLDGEEVGNRLEYTFLASSTGDYMVVLTVTNKGGADEKRATIKVLEKEQPPYIGALQEEYAITVGDDLLLSPEFVGSGDITVEWILNDKVVSTAKEYKFTAAEEGEYKLLLKATNKGGTTEKEVLIIVTKKGDAPVISNLKEAYTVAPGIALELQPSVASDTEVTYSWLLNSEEVATTPQYTFKASRAGSYQLLLRVINDNGTSEKKTTITVETRTQNLKTSIHTILPIEFLAFEAIPEGLNLVVTKSPSSLYRVSIGEKQKVLFIAATTGTYTLEVSIGEAVAETIEIKVGGSPKTLSPYIAKVFDYLPAPGQFVNKLPDYSKGDTHEDMVRKAGEWLIGEDAFPITLGGWGGYVIFGFDHTIVNVKGKRDFRVRGNAFGANDNQRPNAPFGGSCEPGIIMVAYDKNKNGKPDDDEWYEIKGSANFSAKDEPWYAIAKESGNDVNVYRDYEMTYYRPTTEEPETEAEPDNPEKYIIIENYIKWEDNKENSGYQFKNVYHRQSYYPGWITEDKMTFKGIRLAQNGVNEGKFYPDINASGIYYILYGYQYGYVDNKPNMDDDSAIDIDWAIDKNGHPANLPGIDFVKVYNGVSQENGWLGETSTEVERGEDLHMLGISIETLKTE